MTPNLEAEHRLTHSTLGDVVVGVYQSDHETAIVLRYGEISETVPVPVRVHSACVYSEALFSADCDCRDQLEIAYARFQHHGAGVLVYLNQEGRGAGLANKAKSYSLKDRLGLDTVDAYLHLQLDPDSRDYSVARDVLMDLGVRKIILLTNNRRKAEQLQKHDLEVTVEPLLTKVTEYNRSYLEVKEEKLGHLLQLSGRATTE